MVIRRRRLKVVCRVADRIVVTIVLEDDKEDTIKSAVAYRKSLTKIKTRVRLLLVPREWGKADKEDKGRSKVFAL